MRTAAAIPDRVPRRAAQPVQGGLDHELRPDAHEADDAEVATRRLPVGPPESSALLARRSPLLSGI